MSETPVKLKIIRFPMTRPISDPPPRWETIHMGRRTPLYALAWVCKAPEYEKRLPEGTEHDITLTLRTRWFDKFNFTRALCPSVYLGADDNYYLIAMMNLKSFPGFAERSQDPDDELMAAARYALRVSEEDEPTLQWYRYPMSWAKFNPLDGRTA